MPERRPQRGGSRRGGASRGPRRSSSGAPKRSSTSTAEPLHPTLEPPDVESFLEWDLGDDVQGAIAAMGITKPTPIQALAIGPVLAGKDVIAKAETGTGKTLAFGAPMMAKIDPARRSVLGLVLSPTRELAEQVHDVLEKLGEARGVKTCLIVGGEQMQPQVKALQDGAQVVVGTPGRVLDLMGQNFLRLPWTEFAILDEADKMLEIGFIDDVRKILEGCNEYAQTLLFSATFPPQLLDLARSHTSNPAEIATAIGVATVDNIRQMIIKVDSDESRPRVLARIIESSGEDDVFLVFCERRTDVDRLMRRMERERFSVKALHGGYDQAARFKVMGAFRTGEVKCLLATDVASRGLDVAHVTHVINFGVPRDVSDYTHRIGRTGRAGRSGTAVTFLTPRDERRFRELRQGSGFEIEEVVSPRDIFRPARSAGEERAPRSEKTDSAERPRREREERPRRESAEREERPRRDRTEREERPRRESTEREERPRRDRTEREERPRRESTEREERPRTEREERPRRESTEREERPRRDRTEREERPRRDRAERDERPPRERRPRKDEGEARPARDRESGREERAPRRERPAQDPSSGTEPGLDSGPTRTMDRERERPAKPAQQAEPRREQPAAREPRREDEAPARREASGGSFGAGI